MKSGHRLSDLLSRLLLFAIVIAALVGVFGWYIPLIQENQRLQKELADLDQKIERLREGNQAMRLRKQNFLDDPQTVERLVREHLGYAKPGEVVYRFEEKAPAPPGGTGR